MHSADQADTATNHARLLRRLNGGGIGIGMSSRRSCSGLTGSMIELEKAERRDEAHWPAMFTRASVTHSLGRAGAMETTDGRSSPSHSAALMTRCGWLQPRAKVVSVAAARH